MRRSAFVLTLLALTLSNLPARAQPRDGFDLPCSGFCRSWTGWFDDDRPMPVRRARLSGRRRFRAQAAWSTGWRDGAGSRRQYRFGRYRVHAVPVLAVVKPAGSAARGPASTPLVPISGPRHPVVAVPVPAPSAAELPAAPLE